MLIKYQWPREGGTGSGNVPPIPNRKKIVVEKWCYLPEVYIFGEEAELTEKFSEKL